MILAVFMMKKILSEDGNSSAVIDSLQKRTSSPDNIKVSVADREGIVKFFTKHQKKEVMAFSTTSFFHFVKVRRRENDAESRNRTPDG